MAQNQINTGNAVNDGQGDPLRTAFNETNLNFNQIWAAGPVNSNIQISQNTIQAINTNGNIVLATNGIGVVVPAASIVPDIANVRMVGTAATPFNTVYSQYINANSGAYSGNLYVAGNLLVDGAHVSMNQSNLNISNATITVSANAPYAALADGSGLLVGGAGASFTYSAVNNDWVSNLPITAPSFVGDGSRLTNVAAITSAASMTGNTIASTVLYSNLQSVGTLSNLAVSGNITSNNISSTTLTAGQVIAATLFGDGGNISNISGTVVSGNVGNAVYATFAGTAQTANLAAVATQAINADTALVALNASYANSANSATYAQIANIANTACMSDVANSAVVAGMAETIAVQTSITVTGNIVAGGILTDYYYYANGAPFIGGGGGTNYSNANVAAYLPIYSGDMLGLGNIASFGTAFFNNVSITGTTVATTVAANSVSTTGNVDGGAFYSDNYFYANGAPFTGSGYVLGDEQFYGTGSPGPYGLSQISTNNSLIVTINGLVQTPGSSYTVVGDLITFNSVINTNELVDIRFLGIGAGAGNINMPVDWLHVPTDIIPIGNNVQSLGNATNQWKHLWISNNTIYINSIPLTITSGNVLTVNGSNVVTTTGTGNVLSVNNLSVVGNVSGANINAGYLYGDGSNITAVRIINGTSNVAIPATNGNVIVTTNTTHPFTFDTTGNLTLPSNTSSINYANGSPYGGSGTSIPEAPFIIQTTNFTAAAGSRYGVNTAGGSVTATLPTTPTSGQAILFADAGGAFATNNLIINPSTNSIMGGTTGGTMTVSTNNVSVGLFYNGTTWRIYNAG